MPNKIYVEHYGHEDGPQIKVKKFTKNGEEECCGGIHEHRVHKTIIKNEDCGEHRHTEHRHTEHKHHEFKEHKGHEFREFKGHSKHKYDKKRHIHVRPRFEKKIKTKMFISKESLVEYVNEVGELGHTIDVFKIADDLFKVVVVERVEVKKEVEIKVEEK